MNVSKNVWQDKTQKQRKSEAAQQIEELCLQAKHATKMKFRGKHIAVHPCNRGGSMVEAIDVQTLLAFINAEGCI